MEKTDGKYFEVHKKGCKYLPDAENRVNLGYFDDCELAVMKAEELELIPSDGCWHCSPECHIG
ncbi:MAG: hypothetical protein F4222_13405 [Gammaproteobacteria bacterium]|nr:hypothetical protein [Gammaproteobacteria bacterium]MYF60041.1 hypothetical protein [Gammaproteobacteria bacterium]